MRIVQVVPYFFPAWAYGGPAKLVYDISMFLSKNSHQVEVLTLDCYDGLVRMPKDKRIPKSEHLNIHYFKNISNTLAYKHNVYLSFWFFFKSISIVRWGEVVHLHDFYTLHNVWICFLCLLFGKPYILSVHGCLEETRKKEKSILKQIFLRLFGYTMLRKAAYVVATSDNEAESYIHAGVRIKRIVRLGHGINPDEFVSKLIKSEARHKFNLPKTATVFTYLGRLHKIKGLDLLIDAFSRLKEKNVVLVIAGSDDGYGSTVTDLVGSRGLENKVRLLGSVFGQNKADLFAASNVFVYPSRSEGFSLGILEAACAGLPLLLTQGCHFEEAGEVGAAVIVPTTAKSIYEALVRMMNSKVDLKKMGNQARNLIMKKYLLETIGSKYQDLYIKAVSNYGKN